jgi:DNA transformation protein and related proteins
MVDEDAIRDLFAPVGRVSIRKMFGGAGIYLDGGIIALSVEGDIWLKTDDLTQPIFAQAGSAPFTYTGKARGPVATSYWRMPADCHEDEDALRRYVALATQAANRAAARKPDRRPQ